MCCVDDYTSSTILGYHGQLRQYRDELWVEDSTNTHVDTRHQDFNQHILLIIIKSCAFSPSYTMRLEHALVAGALVGSGAHASPVPTKGLQECAIPGNKRDTLDHPIPEQATVESKPNEEVGLDEATTVIISGVDSNIEK